MRDTHHASMHINIRACARINKIIVWALDLNNLHSNSPGSDNAKAEPSGECSSLTVLAAHHHLGAYIIPAYIIYVRKYIKYVLICVCINMHVRISIHFLFSELSTHCAASDSRDAAAASESKAQSENALPDSVERFLTALGPIGWLLRPGHHVINPDDT